jgi:hypothetical protein
VDRCRERPHRGGPFRQARGQSRRPFVKARHNRDLQELLGRSRGSNEFNHANIAAASRGFGQPFLKVYLPGFKFQVSLAAAIERWSHANPGWAEGAHAPATGLVALTPLFVRIPPTLRNRLPPQGSRRAARFTPRGAPRLIGVKTTNGRDRTRFHLTRTELAVADANHERRFLPRIFDFARAPRAFELRPPPGAHVVLTPTSVEANLARAAPPQ